MNLLVRVSGVVISEMGEYVCITKSELDILVYDVVMEYIG